MKLLCWMHRKFRQNSNEALKALVIGQSSLDDQQYYPKSNYGSNRPLKQVQRDYNNNNHHLRKSFTGLEAVRADQEEDYYEEESSDAISDLFHGFLAIGTLGSDQIMAEHPATPTFSISVENITEKETEVTENELKLINDELEKVLSAEAPDDGFNDSSGRNSHVSNGRSSHGSIITLSGKGDDGNGTTVCPLQGYLFGSAIELSETTTTVVQAKKEHRTSLGELFQRSKVAEESGAGGKNDKEMEKIRSEKEGSGGDKSAMNMMKKKLKKKMLHASSRSSTAAGGTTTAGGGGGPADSAPTETKLHKILHMFHRKVHPETSASVLKSGKPRKNDNRKKTTTTHEHGSVNSGNYGGQTHPDEDITLCPQRALFLKQKIRRYRSQSNPPQFTFGSIDSNGNREQWIKTDADYLVLEL